MSSSPTAQQDLQRSCLLHVRSNALHLAKILHLSLPRTFAFLMYMMPSFTLPSSTLPSSTLSSFTLPSSNLSSTTQTSYAQPSEASASPITRSSTT